jgi:hypothetical protein
MKAEVDPTGPLNDSVIRQSVTGRDVVAAWGVHGDWRRRDADVIGLLRSTESVVTCLGTTKEGHPRHPLYVPAAQCRVPFPSPEEPTR